MRVGYLFVKCGEFSYESVESIALRIFRLSGAPKGLDGKHTGANAITYPSNGNASRTAAPEF